MTDESPEEMGEIISLHRDIIENGIRAVDKYDEVISRMKARGFTKGHYYRGV